MPDENRWDRDALESKREEVELLAQRLTLSLGTGPLPPAQFVAAFVTLTPPEKAPAPVIYHITVIRPMSQPQASTRKLGNLTLNWRKLLDVVPDAAIVSLGGASLPVPQLLTWALVGLYVWNKLLRGTEDQLSDSEAPA